MIATTRKKRPAIKRPDASADVLRAIARWKVGLPEGEPHEVDRAIVATMLSFGRELDHDPAISGALLLLERTRETLRKMLRTCKRDRDVQVVHAVFDQLGDASDSLRTIEPVGFIALPKELGKANTEVRRCRNYEPTPEDIAAACAEIRASR